MPWASHSQLLTLAHVSSRDASENTITRHPCWDDALFAKLVHGTIMVHEPVLKAQFVSMGLDGSPSCPSLVVMGEFVFAAQSASVLLWHVYKAWGIEPVFVDDTFGPFVPLALIPTDIHCDQRTVLQALASLTAWHKDPFATTITLHSYAVPPVLLLLKHSAIHTLRNLAPVTDSVIGLRLHAFSNVDIQQCVSNMTPMYYTDIDPTTPMLPAYTALIQLAGVESLYGTPTQQQMFDAHKSVLFYYDALVRPATEQRGKSILPILANLISSDSLFEKTDGRITGFAKHCLRQPSDDNKRTLLYVLTEKLKMYYNMNQTHYARVFDLGRYSKGQFAVRKITLASTTSSFWHTSAKLAL